MEPNQIRSNREGIRTHVRNLHGCGQPLSQLTWCLCFQADTFFGDLIGRDAAVREVGKRATATPAGGHDRMNNPMLATAAAMGAGKTTFLQQLPRRLANHENSKYREFMQETVSVFITFNAKTDRKFDSHVKDVEVAAGTRVLFE